ncbi:MAG: hypothetical protein H6713_29560 [Myxococcales bacterium]|nr:hypothetical protein [Myxococcales bacterium]
MDGLDMLLVPVHPRAWRYLFAEAPWVTPWIVATALALLLALVSRRRRLALISAGLALALTLAALAWAVVDIALTYEFMLRLHRLTEPPWPSIPAERRSTAIAGRIHNSSWFALAWGTALLLVAAPAFRRARRRCGAYVHELDAALLCLPIATAGALITSWGFEWVLAQPFRNYWSAPPCGWPQATLAHDDLELRRAILQGVIALTIAALAGLGWRRRAAPSSRASLLVGASVCALGVAAVVAVAPLRADVRDPLRHDEARHEHQPVMSTEADLSRLGFAALERCEPVLPLRRCELKPYPGWARDHETRRALGYDEEGCETSGGVYLWSPPDTPMEDVHAALAQAADEGVTRVHVMALRATPVTRRTTRALARFTHCSRVLYLEPGARGIPTRGAWGDFVARRFAPGR